MSTEITFRELKFISPEAHEELTELLIDVVEDGASVGFLSPLSKIEADQYWEDVLQPGVVLWIAESNQRIVGSIQLQLALKSNAAHRAEVAKLMVHPEFRRRGIAKVLMERAEERAVLLSRTLLVLDTRAGDPSNVLYQSMGYIEVGRIPKYAKSSNGVLDDTVIYYKEI